MAENKVEKLVNWPLPFGLSESGLETVVIEYAYYSSKTGAGEQELTIRGDGKVALRMTRSAESEAEIIEGRLEPAALVRLLDLMEEENVFGLTDIPGQEPRARRILRLSIGGREKILLVDEPQSPEFERIVGAIKLAAGLAVPAALGHRFFPNL